MPELNSLSQEDLIRILLDLQKKIEEIERELMRIKKIVETP